MRDKEGLQMYLNNQLVPGSSEYVKADNALKVR